MRNEQCNATALLMRMRSTQRLEILRASLALLRQRTERFHLEVTLLLDQMLENQAGI